MQNARGSGLGWTAVGLVLALTGSWLIAQRELDNRRAAFDTDARIVHRLLSQQAVQHDAVLSTLALLAPERSEDLPRLSAIHPRLLSVLLRSPGEVWSDEALRRAEQASAQKGHAVMVEGRLDSGRYTLLRATHDRAYALVIALDGLVPAQDWPMERKSSPVRVQLEWTDQRHVLQAGWPSDTNWRLDFRKPIASESQAMDVVATRWLGWGDLPWTAMALWCLAVGVVLWTWRQALRQREARERAEALLRLGQVGRLNAMGELAAGLAHELNQPLTAVLANTQAAQRSLDEDDPAAREAALDAMRAAVTQARRAADVLSRLRRGLDRGDRTQAGQRLLLGRNVRAVLHLLQPELDRWGVTVQWTAEAPLEVRADPVAVDQIVHNLVQNALQAMAGQQEGTRHLRLSIQREAQEAVLAIEDSGPGMTPEQLKRVFEPFFSSREGGLGLGLTLCESLAQAQGGRVTAASATTGGARFCLYLPIEASRA